MSPLRTITIALDALRRNTMRAVLTALGIIIGIAAVIAMVELGAGSSAAIQQTISSMGANTLLVLPGTAASGGVSYGAGSVLTLTAEDNDAIIQSVPRIKDAAPIVRSRAQVVFGSRNWVPQYIYGTTQDFLSVRDWTQLAEGTMFSERDVRSGAKVCLVGQTLVRELFAGLSPVGKEMRIQNVLFKVVGVLSSKGANMMGMDQDDIVIAPWTTIKYRVSGSSSGASGSSSSSSSSSGGSETSNSTDSLYPSTGVALYPESDNTDTPLLKRFANIDQILISAETSEDIQPVIDSVTSLLRERHHLRAEEPEDFQVRNMAEMTNALSSTSTLMTRLLLSVACISLIVGGVGIMNIMLVSVTERTREIGLRMAVGARTKDILRQFLVEAVVLCLSGGILGIVLGRGVSILVTMFLGWPTQMSIAAILSATVVSVAVGLIFGYYPAARAANLNPIEALRYE